MAHLKTVDNHISQRAASFPVLSSNSPCNFFQRHWERGRMPCAYARAWWSKAFSVLASGPWAPGTPGSHYVRVPAWTVMTREFPVREIIKIKKKTLKYSSHWKSVSKSSASGLWRQKRTGLGVLGTRLSFTSAQYSKTSGYTPETTWRQRRFLSWTKLRWGSLFCFSFSANVAVLNFLR